jgi:glycosyltransferase involved in cell wall biosynthesis
MICQVGIPEENSHTVHNGIDLDLFGPPRETDQLKEPISLLYAGGVVEHKGVLTAVEAMGHLARRFESNSVHLTVLGHGPPAYFRSLEHRVNKLRIDKLVTFRDWIPRAQMPALLREHDILVFPSIWPEPLARIVQEAMASGLVVVASRTGGTPEIISHKQNGLTFEAKNATELADRIALLINDPESWQRFSVAGRETIRQRFTLERMVAEVETHLLQAASGSNRSEKALHHSE